MELIFVYVEEYKVLNKMSFVTHPLFNVEFINGEVKISKKDDRIMGYYNGIAIKAIIGKNGSGKSTALEFIEESFNYTESSGFMVWFNKNDNTFTIQNVNYAIDMLTFDFCYPHSVMKINNKTLKKNNHNIVKINNLSGFLPSAKSQKTPNIIDLSLGKQKSLIGNTKNLNLRKLITFFNESGWIKNKKVIYTYNFSFKSPSNIIRNWVFETFRKNNSNLKSYVLKNKFSESYDFIFFPFDPVDVKITSHHDIFYKLITRNIFSLIKYTLTTNIVDNAFAESLVLRTLDYISIKKHISPFSFIALLESAYYDWKAESNKNINMTGFDCDILKAKVVLTFKQLEEVARTIYEYISFNEVKIISDNVVINDFEVIVKLLDSISKLPKHISNNFSYGWTGFSTGELAKLNIFSSIYNYVKNNKSNTTLFILDEVDLYLHPEWQRTLISEMISFFTKETDVSKVQILITTHSPLIIGDFLADDIISLQIDNNGNSILSEPYGFGTEITDSYISGMHIASTFGEHSRNKILQLVKHKLEDSLNEDEYWLISCLKDSSIKRMLEK